MKNLKNVNDFKGITLIALIITIVILLILSSVAIKIFIGDSGLFSKTKKTTNEYNKTQIEDKLKIKILEIQINKQGKATLGDVIKELKENSEYTIYNKDNEVISKADEIDEEENELFIVYKNYKFKIDEHCNITLVDEINITETESSNEKDFTESEIDKVINYDRNIQATVPTMSSNSNGNVTVFSDCYWNSSYYAYHAFDDNLATCWNPNGTLVENHYIGVKYNDPKVIKKLEMQFPINKTGASSLTRWCLPSEFKLLASNDEINYTEIQTFHIEDKLTKERLSFTVNNDKEYLYYKIEIEQKVKYNEEGGEDYLIGYLQFFGYDQYNPAIENLTSSRGSNLEVYASSTWENSNVHLPYYAFDGKLNTGWNAGGNSTGTQFIECKFDKVTNINGYLFAKSTYNNVVDIPNRIYFKASNDGTNFILLDTCDIITEQEDKILYRTLNNRNYYKYYRIEYQQEISQAKGGPDIMFGRIQMYK